MLPLTTQRAKADFGLTIFYAAFAVCAVALRFFCRVLARKRLRPDDYTILASLVWPPSLGALEHYFDY